MAAAALLAAAAAEVALRQVSSIMPQLEADIYRKDEAGDLRLAPSIVRRHVTPHWDVEIRTNEAGFRDEPLVQTPPPTAVLGLGDSFAFGWGVELDETFYSLIERRLGVRVIKAGIPGTGPLDQLNLLTELLPRYRPALVVEALYVGNDFTDVALGGSAQFGVEDGLLVRKPLEGEATPSGLMRAARRSRLLQTLRAVQFNWTRSGDPDSDGPPRTWDAWMREFASVHLSQPPPRTREAVERTLDVLGRMAKRCEEHGVGFLLLVIPRSVQIYDDEEAEMLRSLGWSANDVDMGQPQRRMNDWASARGIEVIDLLNAFREAPTAPDAKLYYSPDAHLRPSGHALAAEIAYPAVARALEASKATP